VNCHDPIPQVSGDAWRLSSPSKYKSGSHATPRCRPSTTPAHSVRAQKVKKSRRDGCSVPQTMQLRLLLSSCRRSSAQVGWACRTPGMVIIRMVRFVHSPILSPPHPRQSDLLPHPSPPVGCDPLCSHRTNLEFVGRPSDAATERKPTMGRREWTVHHLG